MEIKNRFLQPNILVFLTAEGFLTLPVFGLVEEQQIDNIKTDGRHFSF